MNVLHKPVLSLETATPVCSVALRMPDGRMAAERAEGRGVHSELTFVFIDRLLRDAGLQVADLGAVLVSAGPGSYTGLRVGSSAVKGLLFDTEIPLYACNTLAGIACGVRLKAGSVAAVDAVIDARRNHLYHQVWKFGKTGIVAGTDMEIRELDDVLERWKSGGFVAGTGTERIRQLAESRGIDTSGLRPFPGSEVISAEWMLEYVGVYMEQSDGGSESGGHTSRRAEQKQKTGIRSMTVIRRVDPARFEPDYFSNL